MLLRSRAGMRQRTRFTRAGGVVRGVVRVLMVILVCGVRGVRVGCGRSTAGDLWKWPWPELTTFSVHDGQSSENPCQRRQSGACQRATHATASWPARTTARSRRTMLCSDGLCSPGPSTPVSATSHRQPSPVAARTRAVSSADWAPRPRAYGSVAPPNMSAHSPFRKTLPTATIRSPAQTAYCRQFALPTHDAAISIRSGVANPKVVIMTVAHS